MMHNSAKNMTYISQEGVDMDGDMDRGALSSSNCNTVDIISTFFFFLGFLANPNSRNISYRQKIYTSALFSTYSAI